MTSDALRPTYDPSFVIRYASHACTIMPCRDLSMGNITQMMARLCKQKISEIFLKSINVGIYLLGRGTARSSNQAPNNAIDTKQKAHKQE